jgi:hypothetical protein
LEVRLAYEKGLLTQRNVSYFQNWALLYWMYMQRRTAIEDTQAELIQQTFNLFPERWSELYRAEIMAKLGLSDGMMPEGEAVDDLNEIDAFLSRLEQGRRWVGADALGLPTDWTPDTQGTPV